MSRISQRFSELRERGEKALVPFITGGDPGILATVPLVLELEAAGADVVEIGVPFSDPLADGKSNQAAYHRALERGVTLQDVLDSVRQIRQVSQIPIVLMSYMNPVLHYGMPEFVDEAARVGVDGMIMTDLTPEESGGWLREARRVGLDTIFLLAPTSTHKRIELVTQVTTGFTYCVSRVGVTGAQATVSGDLDDLVVKIREHTDNPIVVGFGISSREQVQRVCSVADGAVVGSALVDFIHARHRQDDFLPRVREYVRDLKSGTVAAAVSTC